MTLSDSDLLAISILAVAFCAIVVLVGGLFWVMVKNGRKAREEADVFRGLEDVFEEEKEAEPTKGSPKKSAPQEWEKDADWWKGD